MTINTQDRTAGPFSGNDVTTVFPFEFKVFQNSDLLVFLTVGAAAPSTLQLYSDYSVALNADQNANPGGSVTLLGGPLATGSTLDITSSIAATQPTELTNQGGFFPKVIEDALDRLTILFQQLGFQSLSSGLYSLKQVLRYQELEGGGPLPLLADRKNKLLGFDNDGNPTSVAPVSDSAQGLRIDLAMPSGASMIGSGGSTVQGALDSQATSIAANTSAIAVNTSNIATNTADISSVRNSIFGANLSPLVVDMHYGVLAGSGWLGDGVEPGGYTPTPTTVTAQGNIGNLTLTVADASIFRQFQLIAFQGASGTWWSSRIRSIATNVLTLTRSLPETIPVGSQIVYFYANDAHPNQYGYWAIADDAIRNLVRKEEVAWIGRNYEVWSPVLSATVTGVTLGTINANAYEIPGATVNSDRAALVTVTDINQGAMSEWVSLTAGEYNAHLVINQGERTGSFSGSVTVSIIELRADGNIYQIANRVISGYSGIQTVDIGVKVSPGSSIQTKVVSNNGGGATFYLGRLTYGRVIEHTASLNHGTHVLFGDSWFASGFLMSRLQARLPKATFINKGVSGNKATDLISRFDADVRNSGANFVWLMCGTNDYYADVTPSLFEQQMNQVTAAVQSISAQPIAFTASVGDAFYAPVPGERLTVSRQYAVEVNYHAHTAAPDWVGSKYRSANFSRQAVSVPATSSVVVGAIAGTTALPAYLRFLFVSGGGLSVRIGYASVIDTTTLSDQSTFASAAIVKGQRLPKSDTQARFILIVLQNPSGSTITTDFCADIAWVQA